MGIKNHILFLTVGPRRRASARYRAIQYIPFLEESGFIVSVLEPIRKPKSGIKRLFVRWKEEQTILSQSENADIVFIQKRLFRPTFVSKLKRKGCLIVFDFDDIIHTTDDQHWSNITQRRIAKRFQSTCYLSDIVIAGNSYLATIAEAHNRNVKTLSTVVDFSRYQCKTHSTKKDIVLGWIGQPNNYPLLESLHPILSQISKKYSNVKILVISKGMPKLPDLKLEIREWSEENEADDLLSIDIGLMPMLNDDWSKGKCALKAIQYMAAGIPVVCADVGANREVVRHAIDGFRPSTDIEWKTYLERLIIDKKLRATMGKYGRKRIKQYYNLENESRSLGSWLHEELNKYHRKSDETS